jgi:aryl-alcohol dehydrogenase-like predicted oxidoreductase
MTSPNFLSTLTAAVLLIASDSDAYTGVAKPTTKMPMIRKQTVDTTSVGSIRVPTVGTGTISWSSDSLFSTENEDVDAVIKEAYRSNAAFFDTAERYGTHYKTALGMGYGETERMTSMYLKKAELTEGASLVNPVVATKFTPVPWRTTVQSVVDACEESCKNLGVDQIDLYQIHMPDSKFCNRYFVFYSVPSCHAISHLYQTSPTSVVQPLRAFGKVENKDKIYWDGLAECYNRGLVKNVGVW